MCLEVSLPPEVEVTAEADTRWWLRRGRDEREWVAKAWWREELLPEQRAALLAVPVVAAELDADVASDADLLVVTAATEEDEEAEAVVAAEDEVAVAAAVSDLREPELNLAELLLPPLVDVEGESAAAAAEVAAAEEPFPREEVVS